MKISNGFVLIADYDKVDSFIFLEKHLENIHSISNTHNEILFIINKKSAYDTVNFSKEDSLVESKINYLKEYYNISPLYINLWESWRGLYDEKDKFTIQKFLEHILMKKLGEIFKIKENSSNIKLNYSKSPNKIKNPIKISPNTLEISNFLNITKKRTRSVKKNLNHIFEKLKLESI